MSNTQHPAGVVELGTITSPDQAVFDCPGCDARTVTIDAFPPVVHVHTQHERGCTWLQGQVDGR